MININGQTLSNIGGQILNNLGGTFNASIGNILMDVGSSSIIGGDGLYSTPTTILNTNSLLGANLAYIGQNILINNLQGTAMKAEGYDGGRDDGCYRFTFYKEKPSFRFANPYVDNTLLRTRWHADVKFPSTVVDNVEYFYNEAENGSIPTISDLPSGAGTALPTVNSFDNLETCELIKKTNSNFRLGKIDTIIARFHTSQQDMDDSLQTAVSRNYGMSHGRNLLRAQNDRNNKSEGYDNPYCRVWTYHHQYNTMVKAIRPFGGINSAEELENEEANGNIEQNISFRTLKSDNFGGGSKRLDTHGVLNYKNGFVNIAPTATIKDYFEHTENNDTTYSTKKCMFSIENLAWKESKIKNDEYDPYGLSPEQRGPLGGRIMWFPPYDLKFNEGVTTKWNSNEFIGRGENIYTYTNTERSGNLSFTMVIDHPSILDYWDRKDTSDVKSNDVDSDNDENSLLRFFAGCEILHAKPQKYWKRTAVEEPKVEEEKGEVPKDENSPKKGKLMFVVYYPNNYSGVDDVINGKTSAISYLINGIGTQKYVEPCRCRECNYTWYPENTDEGLKNKTYIECPKCRAKYNSGNTNAFINLTPKDIPFDLKKRISDNCGYEINNNISITKSNLVKDKNIIKKSYADIISDYKRGQYLTDENGNPYEVEIPDTKTGGTMKVRLAKMVHSSASALNDAPKVEWYFKRWFYRVDKAYEHHKLTNINEYVDSTCSNLNGVGYHSFTQNPSVSSAFGFDMNDSATTLVSLADMYAAIEKDTSARELVSNQIDNSNIELIKKIMNKEYTVTSISINGHASYQGYVTSNIKLASDRANTVKNWLKDCGFPGADSAAINKNKNQSTRSNPNTIRQGEVGDENVKLWRSAAVIIEYDTVKVSDAVTEEPTVTKDGEVTTEKTSLKKPPIDAYKEAENFRNDQYWKMMSKLNPDKEYNNYLTTNYDDSKNKLGIKVEDGIVHRYDNEGEFFKMLERDKPFLHHLISEKIKYFDPAFHAISPEGFNARLTFLHQCTRQGSTTENNASFDSSTAYNLAFGRPPICVLRLGDFYYTKIVINSLDIQYESPQWDLNPEGIGVMPMFANINIRFTFLGGSDLGGPIARLQNAVSFNYYANTSVYDDRAEMVEYSNDGSGDETAFKGWNYPSDNANYGSRFKEYKKE
jgi:hypothetical protein